MTDYKSIFEDVKKASRTLALLSDEKKNDVLLSLADEIEAHTGDILASNAQDLARMEKTNPLYDRLALSAKRLSDIASDMRHVASLPSPGGKILDERTLPNGLHLRKVQVPFGVIGAIYEARPNVTFDIFSLCFKAGNACVLKGGKDADASNRAAISLIRDVLGAFGLNPDCAVLLPSEHEAAGALLGAVGYVDLVIPRGGRRLIDFVRNNAKVPCIETGAGVVHLYFESSGDPAIGRAALTNGKTRRVSVCNATDCLVIDKSRLGDISELCSDLAGKNVELFCDAASFAALDGKYPANLLAKASDESFGTEYLDYKMAVKTVDGLDEAISHINRFGSGHSEAVITEDKSVASEFQARVDAACVYVNAPTSFTDGAQFGLGAEIGISTQKLGARGPMGLEEICTYKWLIDGRGQVRG